MEDTKENRSQRLLQLADQILDKLTAQVEQATPGTLNPQAMKHVTAVLKDLRDIQGGVSDGPSGQIRVVFEGQWEEFSG